MIEQLLAAAARGETQMKRRGAIPAMAAELLREAAERYEAHRRSCRFDPGSFVTPRKDGHYTGAGEPHLVVECRTDVHLNFSVSQPGSVGFGQTFDMRVLSYSDGSIVAHWVESWQFEPWEPAKPAADEPAEQP